VTKLGVLGDVHCEDAIVAAALELFAREGVERTLAVGDLVDGLGDPMRTLDLLRGVDAVRGNHDRWLLNNELRDMADVTAPAVVEPCREWLASLPVTRTYSAGRLS
jgi:predicted phosphodiesterase